MKSIRILGVDPALRNTGTAVFDYSMETGLLDLIHLHIIQTEKFEEGVKVRQTSDDVKCAQYIVKSLRQISEEFRPTFVASEVSAFSQSSRGAVTNGICIGILASFQVPVVEVSMLEVKRAAGGEKQSSKEHMVHWATEKWPNGRWLKRIVKGETTLLKANEHLADACAAAQASIYTPQFAQAVQLMRAMAN